MLTMAVATDNTEKRSKLFWRKIEILFFFHFSGIASFCKTRPVACKFPFYDGNGDLHNNCTNTKLYADDENSSENVNFLWCATETNEDDDMVFWGKCDLESCFPEKKGNYLVLKSYNLDRRKYLYLLLFSFGLTFLY